MHFPPIIHAHLKMKNSFVHLFIMPIIHTGGTIIIFEDDELLESLQCKIIAIEFKLFLSPFSDICKLYFLT